MPNIKMPRAGGINLQPGADQNSAEIVKNMRYDAALQCWVNDRGWGQFWSENDSDSPIDFGGFAASAIVSLACYQKHQGRETYILFEWEKFAAVSGVSQGCILTMITPWDAARDVDLETARSVPGTQESGTLVVPFGRMALIINGRDQPRKLLSGQRLQPFGFHERPAPPTPINHGGSSGVWPGGSGDHTWTYKDSETGEITIRTGGTIQTQTSFGIPNNATGPGTNDDGATAASAEFGLPSSFQYAVSFVSATGSEGPLSTRSMVISFECDVSSSQPGRVVIPVEDIPIGPDGTMARRIYRTKDMQTGTMGAGSELYFLDEIPNNIETLYMDACPDSQLGSLAQDIWDSDVMPLGVLAAAWFRNRMLVGGGAQHPERVYYSTAGQPERFPTNNYFDVGNSQNGDVVHLQPHEDVLLVFRRHAIDIIVPSELTTTSATAPPFYLSSLVSGIGTASPRSVVSIPGLGTIFLAQDGFYVLTGQHRGEKGIRISRISDSIGAWINRVNKVSAAKACATYNAHDQEYWCQVPVDGSQYPSIGLVYHVAADAWSVRTGIPVSAFAQLPSGHTVFGSHAPAAGSATADDANQGLFVWSAVDQWGYSGTSESASKVSKPTSKWKSVWLDFGEPTVAKKITRITADVITYGDNSVTLDYYINGEGLTSKSSKPTRLQRYHPSDSITGETMDSIVLGSTPKFRDRRRAQLRWDIDSTQCHSFQFQLVSYLGDPKAATYDESTLSTFRLIGFTIEATIGDRKIVWSPGVE